MNGIDFVLVYEQLKFKEPIRIVETERNGDFDKQRKIEEPLW